MPRNPKHIAIAVTLSACALPLPYALAAPARTPAPAKAPERLLAFDTCTKVHEGDLIEGKKVGLIRLIGVIAPAKGEPGYQEAIEYTRKLTVGRQIKVEICHERPNDYRGRLRAVVYLPDAVNLNTKLLRAGIARILEHTPCHVDAAAWRTYEADAQKAKRGLWAPEGTPAAAVAPSKPKTPSGARVRIRPSR